MAGRAFQRRLKLRGMSAKSWTDVADFCWPSHPIHVSSLQGEDKDDGESSEGGEESSGGDDAGGESEGEGGGDDAGGEEEEEEEEVSTLFGSAMSAGCLAYERRILMPCRPDSVTTFAATGRARRLYA